MFNASVAKHMVTIKISALKGMILEGMIIKGMMIERGKGSIMLLQLILVNPHIRGGIKREILMMNTHFILLLQVPLQVMMKYGWWTVVPVGTWLEVVRTFLNWLKRR